MLSLVLLVFAFVFALIAAFWPTWLSRAAPHWGWLAIACLIASMIWGAGGVATRIGHVGSIVTYWIG
jgi:hypothetical protein